ncbi:MAG: prolyl oligopeptidase family serine peptidase [Bacteroidia bacterium]|nr:prolyl oligopeptidase family serine peptidase [Bacteroidia bacterium]
MNKLLMIPVLLVILSCTQTKLPGIKVAYPMTKKCDTVDNYFGIKIADPYRWLEDDNSSETMAWVKAENEVTTNYLKQIPFRDKIRERLTKIMNFPKITAPFKKGGRIFYYKNEGLQNQSELYTKESIDAKESRVVLDPNKFSTDGTVALAGMNVSKDGQKIAYSIARSGSDWNEILVRDIISGNDLADHLYWVKFSGIAWCGDGFYYSRYDAPKDNTGLTKKNEFQKVYYHKIGTKQDDDVLVFENRNLPSRMFSAETTEDEKYLIIYESETSDNNSLYYKEINNPKQNFVKLADGFDYEYGVIDNIGSTLLVKTNKNAPRYKLVAIDLNNPAEANWKTIIPESENVLQSCSLAGDKIITVYMKDACSEVKVYAIDGKFKYNITLPGIGTLSAFNGKKADNIAFYSFTSFTNPGIIFKYDIASDKSQEYMKTEVSFDVNNYETHQVFFTSKDGTKVPMFIVHKKGIELNGENPTLLTGYGGFNISETPYFSVSRMIWLENGGVFALANLRGGGEYGEKWHEAGTKLNKQNVFDDFIAAAEYLIKEKYTSPARLTIQGGSNGGLLIGAVINQRPDLFAVAIPQVGVMDMLRFHKFTIGWAWKGDYGSSEDKQGFDNLVKYSPLHNIKEGVNYPAVLVTTADHDDRVVPAHSFKYIATLQNKYKGENPVLIRIDSKAGHGGGKPTSKIIDEMADLWSFAFYNMNFTPSY